MFRFPTRRAFTLIELLVVVAIIALLISILLPALHRGKEQGRIAVCLANLRTIGQATQAYLTDGNDTIVFAFPVGYSIEGTTMNYSLWTEFIWGGGQPHKQPADWRATGSTDYNPATGRTDTYVTRPKDRPLNRYIASSVSWDDPRRMSSQQRWSIPMDLPGFFKCPSDSTFAVPMANAQNRDIQGDTAFTTWEFWGSSYPNNWYWPYYYEQAPPGNGAPYGGDFLYILAGFSSPTRSFPSLTRHILKTKGGRFASEFVLFYENRLNYALEGARPRGFQNAEAKAFKGWHKQWDYHAANFLDGSARYTRYDTRYVDGPGWTIWPNRPWDGTWKPYNNN